MTTKPLLLWYMEKTKRGRPIKKEIDDLVFYLRTKKKLTFREIEKVLQINVRGVHRRYLRVKAKKEKARA